MAFFISYFSFSVLVSLVSRPGIVFSFSFLLLFRLSYRAFVLPPSSRTHCFLGVPLCDSSLFFFFSACCSLLRSAFNPLIAGAGLAGFLRERIFKVVREWVSRFISIVPFTNARRVEECPLGVASHPDRGGYHERDGVTSKELSKGPS